MPQFYTNETLSLEKQVENIGNLPKTDPNILNSVYEIDKCVEWIETNRFIKVCLQFPDNMLKDAADVALQMQFLLKYPVYILGDTSYESCCIDYVAAAHINADAVVHFGPICFSKAAEIIPCLAIYEKSAIDVNILNQCVCDLISDLKMKVFVLLDTPYLWKHAAVTQSLAKFIEEVEICTVLDENLQLKGSNVLFIGSNPRKLLNFKFFYNPLRLFHYNPSEACPTINDCDDSKIIKRRNYLNEKIKDSTIFGIIVGTLAVKNYIKVIERIKALINLHGKKYYTISVGKPTVAKLANFPEIDIYIVVTCSMSEIYESRDFYKPIVTPFDIELALNPNADTKLQFSFDYNSFLPDDNKDLLDLKGKLETSDVSLLSGAVRYGGSSPEASVDVNKEIALRSEGALAVSHGSGTEYLAGRTWKGLEPKLGESDVHVATEGRAGIAQGYQHEKGSC